MLGWGCNGCLMVVDFSLVEDNYGNNHQCLVRAESDPKLPDDSEEVPNSEWNGWWFNSRYQIFSLYLMEKTS